MMRVAFRKIGALYRLFRCEHESEPITFRTLGLETRIFSVLPLPSPKHLLFVKADDWPNKEWKQR
jgi:hypothetical protein